MTSTADPAAAVIDEWRSVLGSTESAPEDDFFVLGGNSLMAVAFAERVEQRLGIEFPIEVLFMEATLGAVIDACTKRVGNV